MPLGPISGAMPTIMVFSIDPNVDADSYLLASTKVDANTEMSLLFLNPHEAKFPAKLLAMTN
jgi:hypothetical protein